MSLLNSCLGRQWKFGFLVTKVRNVAMPGNPGYELIRGFVYSRIATLLREAAATEDSASNRTAAAYRYSGRIWFRMHGWPFQVDQFGTYFDVENYFDINMAYVIMQF